MKRSRKTILIIILVLIILLGLSITYLINKINSDEFAKPGKVSEIEFVIVKNAFGTNQIDILKPNAILLITNKREIEIDQELFLAEKDVNHFCGYDYEIQFWNSTDSLVKSVFVNQECETFSYKPFRTWRQFNRYKKQLSKKPTHYLYKLEFLANCDIEKTKKQLKNEGVIAFLHRDEYKQNHMSEVYFQIATNIPNVLDLKMKLKEISEIKEITEYHEN